MADGETLLAGGEAGGKQAEVSQDTGKAQDGAKPVDTTGVKPAVAGETGEAGKADDKAVKTGAPEKYEFKLPEGVTLDEKALGEVTPLFKEANVTQEQAQKFVDYQMAREANAAKVQQEAWAKINTDWVATAKADKEIGGTEAKFNESLGLAKTAIKAFGNEEFSKMFNATGVGNHPEFIRFMAKVGKAIGEDKMHVGGSPAGEGEKSLAERLYPNHK